MEKVAVIFPGQGSQYVGMSKSLYNQFQIVRDTFEEANDVLGFDLKKICFEGGLGELSKIKNALVAILTSSVAAFRVYASEVGIKPEICAGHSLGEFSALTCSGAMKFSDALNIVYSRSLFAQELADEGKNAMTIIDGVEYRVIDKECKKKMLSGKYVEVSCFNGTNQITISGEMDAVEEIEDIAINLGGNITPLLNGVPFHCKLMKPVAEKLNGELKKYNFYNLRYPVLSNYTAKPYREKNKIADLLTNQLTNPVRWKETIEYFQNIGITLIVEIGPQNILNKLINDDYPDIKTMCFDYKGDREFLMNLGQSDLYSKFKTNVITGSLNAASSTCNNRSITKEEYENGVIKPYRKIQEMQNKFNNYSIQPKVEEMKEALELLKIIFETKGVSLEERERWFNNILEESGTQYILSKFN